MFLYIYIYIFIYYIIDISYFWIHIYIYIYYIIEYGHEAKRPSYEYESSVWPLPGMMGVILSCAPGIMTITIMVRARNYDYNYCCQHFWKL